MVANKLFEIVLANFFAVEKMLPKKMVISYATKIPVIQLDGIGTMAIGTCESLASEVPKATKAIIRQPHTKITDLRLQLQIKRSLILHQPMR